MGPLSSLVLGKNSPVFDLFLFSYSFFFSSIYTLLICTPTLLPFFPYFFLLYFILSSPVFSICFLSCSFFPTFFTQATTAFSYNEKCHIVKVLYFPTSSHTPSWEQNVPGVLPAEPLATKLAPSHACTPGMHSHSMGFLSAISYVAGLLFHSGTGLSNYKSNYLEKLSLKTRGSKSIYHNPHPSGENGKTFITLQTYVLLPYI